MNVVTKVIVWIVLSLLAAFGARAQDAPTRDVQAGRMVICGSAEKAQLFAAQNQDIQAAIANDDGRAVKKVPAARRAPAWWQASPMCPASRSSACGARTAPTT